MEPVLTALIAMVTALAGAWVGFYLSYKKSRRLRTAEFILDVVSIEFSLARSEMREKISKNKDHLNKLADPADDDFVELRNKIFHIFNTYTMICDLHERGDIDRGLFKDNLSEIIVSDYLLIDPFFEEVAKHQGDAPDALRRPFFPCIAKVVGSRDTIAKRDGLVQPY